MIKTIFLRALFLTTAITLLSFTTVDKSSPFLMEGNRVQLNAGTVVSLQLNENVSSELVEVGNAVEFLVRSDVTVDGKVVISTGSIAEGWVKEVVKTCDSCGTDHCAKLVITIENVQATDGQRVNLRSIPHTVRGKCCCGGGPATAKIGTVMSARVLNNTKINA